MSKHTPGPWLLEQTTVYALNNERVPVNRFTASLDRGWSDNSSRILQQEVEANAHLIAAAPDLLEALSEIINDGGKFVMTQETHRKARAAIAKARGEV